MNDMFVNVTLQDTVREVELDPSLETAQALQIAKNIEEELNVPVSELRFDWRQNDIALPFELVLKLINHPELIGFVAILRFLVQVGFPVFKKQYVIARLMGLTKKTFAKKRDQLIDLGLLVVDKKRGKWVMQNVAPLADFMLPSDVAKQEEYLLSFATLPVEDLKATQQRMLEQQRVQQERMIAKKLNDEAKRKESAKKLEEERKKKVEAVKFPEEDYAIVLRGFLKHKGIKLAGPEVARAKKSIKLMFLAEHTPKQIVDCMKFFQSVQDDEEYPWLRNWTIETVMKKMAEFKAGKLKQGTLAEQYERI